MAAERNLYFGIDGNVTYTKHIQSIISSIPPDKLLLETDAPYLTPNHIEESEMNQNISH